MKQWRCATAVFGLGMVLETLSAAGGVVIGGVSYDHVDPGPPFTERPRPAQVRTPPVPTAAEKDAGMLAYVTADPGDYRPTGIPRKSEHAAELSTSLAQGQDEAVWFGVHALRELRGLRVSADVHGAPVTVDVRTMHFWPQRTGWRSRQWYVTPELLLPCRDGRRSVPTTRGVLADVPFNIAARETAAFWLTLSTGADAKPGSYAGTVTVSANTGPALHIPLRIEVFPFALERPKDHEWLLYADMHRWDRMSDRQVLAELKDFARHGMTGLVEIPLGKADLSGIKSGKVTFDARVYKHIAGLCRKAGLPGPHVCNLGGIPGRVRDALGLKCDLKKDTWPDSLKAGVAAVAHAVVEATKDDPSRWYFYGVDEPSGKNTYAIQEYQSWRRGGAATYATFYDISFLDTASKYLTAPCFVAGLISKPKTARAARETCARTGAEFFWYGTGCYVNPFPQEGCMFSNRYGAGFLFWKTGAKAQVSWTFCRPHEDVFNDFDGIRANGSEPKEQVTAYPHFLKPDDWSTYQGAIPTIAWESLREGVDDYAYFSMLSDRIAAARRSRRPNVRKMAVEATATLEALTRAVPWRSPLGPAPNTESGFCARRMQQVRHQAADLIVRLGRALAGKARAQRVSGERRVRLTVRAVASETGGGALPVVTVAPVSKKPAIDGILAAACWKNATVVRGFRCMQTGQPAETRTEARIAYDDRALYVAFTCREPAMSRLVAARHGRDTPLVWEDDSIELFVGDSARKHYAHIIVNTNAAVYDEKGQDPSWNARLSVGVMKETDRWTVELAVPWSDLARAGVSRAPVMAVNFCRNRFAGSDRCVHTAWSPTYGGFHKPERFGIALLQSGAVVLAGVRLPSLWGRQLLSVRLRNTTVKRLSARIAVDNGVWGTLLLPPGVVREAWLPVVLRTPGKKSLTLLWGVDAHPAQRTPLSVSVPEPVVGTGDNGFVNDGDVMDLPIRVGVAPVDAARYVVRVCVAADGAARNFSLPAKPGASKTVDIVSHGQVRIETTLADRATGARVGVPVVSSLFVVGK